jgi:AraC-like DNA-binding protein
MKMPIKAYILKAKINTAENILVFSDFSIAEIADSLGFSTQSAFSAAFRKISGMTPLQYRSRYTEKYSLSVGG